MRALHGWLRASILGPRAADTGRPSGERRLVLFAAGRRLFLNVILASRAGPAAPGRRSSQRRARPAPLPVGAAPTPRHAPASHPNRPGPQLQPDHGPPCRSPIDPHPPRPTRGHSVPRFGGGGHGRAWTALVDAVHPGGGVGFGGRGRSGRRGWGMLRRVGRRWPVPCAWQKMATSLPRRAWGACPSLACIGRGVGRASSVRRRWPLRQAGRLRQRARQRRRCSPHRHPRSAARRPWRWPQEDRRRSGARS